MQTFYVIGGLILLSYGIWQSVMTLKIYIKGKEDKLGADIKILGSAIGAIMIGIYLLIKYM